MAETPPRQLRVADDVVDQAVKVIRAKVGGDVDFATVARAGLILIGSGAVDEQDLGWAMERARLRAGWPPREERTP